MKSQDKVRIHPLRMPCPWPLIELGVRGTTDYSHFYSDASPAATGVKPPSCFTGAASQVSRCGRFQSFQTSIVFELMIQEGTALKSWIFNCGNEDELYHPGGTGHWAVGKVAGKQTLWLAGCAVWFSQRQRFWEVLFSVQEQVMCFSGS